MNLMCHLWKSLSRLVLLALPLACGPGQEPALELSTPSEDLVIEFTEGNPLSHLSPRYSPPGKAITLEPSDRQPMPGFDHLEGRMDFGPNPDNGHLLVLARSNEGMPYDRLVVDIDGDGGVEGEEVQIARKSKSKRGIWSSFDADFPGSC